MNYSQNPERQRVLRQSLRARTLPEIETAAHELKQWIMEHPDDLGIVDAFEQLSMMEEIASEQGTSESPATLSPIVSPTPTATRSRKRPSSLRK